jgi:hypothetical protein
MYDEKQLADSEILKQESLQKKQKTKQKKIPN